MELTESNAGEVLVKLVDREVATLERIDKDLAATRRVNIRKALEAAFIHGAQWLANRKEIAMNYETRSELELSAKFSAENTDIKLYDGSDNK